MNDKNAVVGLSNVRSMKFFELFDGLLRRRESFFEAIFSDQEVRPLIRWSITATLLLTAIYGLTMGMMSFSSHGFSTGIAQSLSSAFKIPLLYLVSLVVCYPLLYFVIVLIGSRLSFLQTLTLILLAITMNSILLAGCAPIVLFFTFTGSDYVFIKALHVVVFGFSGGWAMIALWHGLTVMCEKSDLYPKQAIRILQIWILVFGFVGAQMAWSLRPFIGSPEREFEFIRERVKGVREGNIYQALIAPFTSMNNQTQLRTPVDPVDSE